MAANFGQVLFKYYSEKLTAERDTTIAEMKNKILLQKLQNVREKEEERVLKEKEDKANLIREIQKLIQEENKKLNKNIIEENNSMKCEINSFKEEIRTLNLKMDQLKKEIKSKRGNQNRTVDDERKSEDITRAGASGKCGTRSIWHAINIGCLEAVKYYYKLDHQVIHLRNENKDSFSPLHYASEYGHLDIVQFLISKGAEIDARSDYESTPLMEASYAGYETIVHYLLDSGAGINKRDEDQETPIHWAVDGNKLKIVKQLVLRGADTRLKNRWNNNPLDFAKYLGDKSSIVHYLSSI